MIDERANKTGIGNFVQHGLIDPNANNKPPYMRDEKSTITPTPIFVTNRNVYNNQQTVIQEDENGNFFETLIDKTVNIQKNSNNMTLDLIQDVRKVGFAIDTVAEEVKGSNSTNILQTMSKRMKKLLHVNLEIKDTLQKGNGMIVPSGGIPNVGNTPSLEEKREGERRDDALIDSINALTDSISKGNSKGGYGKGGGYGDDDDDYFGGKNKFSLKKILKNNWETIAAGVGVGGFLFREDIEKMLGQAGRGYDATKDYVWTETNDFINEKFVELHDKYQIPSKMKNIYEEATSLYKEAAEYVLTGVGVATVETQVKINEFEQMIDRAGQNYDMMETHTLQQIEDFKISSQNVILDYHDGMNELKTNFQSTADEVFKSFESAWDGLQNTVMGTLDKSKTGAEAFMDGLENTVMGTLDKSKTGAEAFMDGLQNQVKELKDEAGEKLISAYDSYNDTKNSLGDTLEKGVNSFVNNVTNGFTEKMGGVENEIGRMGNHFIESMEKNGNAMEKFTDYVKNTKYPSSSIPSNITITPQENNEDITHLADSVKNNGMITKDLLIVQQKYNDNMSHVIEQKNNKGKLLEDLVIAVREKKSNANILNNQQSVTNIQNNSQNLLTPRFSASNTDRTFTNLSSIGMTQS